MKICERGLNFIQIIDAYGTVRICGWMYNSNIGNLLDDELYTIYHSSAADKVRKPLLEQTYENCPIGNCPYRANEIINEKTIEIENIPNLPNSLYLAYEGKCNYNCTCCTSHTNMEMVKKYGKDFENNYEIIEKKLLKVLPYIKILGAHGRGELFASPRILNLLSKWKPVAPIDEIEVRLETNGSLFDKQHWKKIENLGNYNLKVAITVMSFSEPVYQYLSGVKYPINKLIDNLHFVRTLREQNIINEFEIATVLQEQNFREMPMFAKRCIEEFKVDRVRIRPIVPGGRLNQYDQWFMNVRNPEHPYYYEYKRVMSDKIFQHPKVYLWLGDMDDERIKLEELVEGNVKRLYEDFNSEQKVTDILFSMMTMEEFPQKVEKYMINHEFRNCAIWGVGKIGKVFLNMIKLHSSYVQKVFDEKLCGSRYQGILIEKIDSQIIEGLDVIIITSVKYQEEMKAALTSFSGQIVSLEELINDVNRL